MIPDPSKHYVLGFSGGKDSVATWLYLTRELNLPHVTALFADTGHEFPDLNEYLSLLEREHGLPIVRIHAILGDFDGELVGEKVCERLGIDQSSDWRSERLNMERLAILKRRFPSPMARFCTTFLKLAPSRRWMREHCDLENTIRVTGIRAQESPARAAHPVWQDRDEYMGVPIWAPIHSWHFSQVFGLHGKYRVPINPLYLQGMARVGCAPCINAKKEELASIASRRPEAFEALRAMEKRAASEVGKPELSFFAAGKVPDRFASHTCPASGKKFPDAFDVMRWALDDDGTADMFDGHDFKEDDTEDAIQCVSHYGLCE